MNVHVPSELSSAPIVFDLPIEGTDVCFPLHVCVPYYLLSFMLYDG
jgi:hypothetical protein